MTYEGFDCIFLPSRPIANDVVVASAIFLPTHLAMQEYSPFVRFRDQCSWIRSPIHATHAPPAPTGPVAVNVTCNISPFLPRVMNDFYRGISKSNINWTHV